MDRISKCLQVKYAFLGWSLERGTKVIAIGHIVFYSAVFFISMFIYLGPHYEDHEPALESNETINGTDELYEEFVENKDHFMDLSRSYFLEFVMVIQVVFGASLLLGVKHRLPDYLLSWILMQAAQSFFSQFFIIVYFLAVLYGHSYYVKYLLVDEITITAIELYFIAVVLSYYNQLIKETQDEYLSPIIHNTQDESLSPIIINST